MTEEKQSNLRPVSEILMSQEFLRHLTDIGVLPFYVQGPVYIECEPNAPVRIHVQMVAENNLLALEPTMLKRAEIIMHGDSPAEPE